MRESRIQVESRRQFLKYLAASPVLGLAQSTLRWAGMGDGLIKSPEEGLDVFDFEAVAKQTLPPAHWGYMATGTDGDATIQANRDGFKRFLLRPHRLVDVRSIDMSTEVLGRRWPTPIVIAPTGSNRAFHPDGEIAVAKAAKAKNHLQVLSNVASTSIEDAIAARGEPIWFQLYPRDNWEVTKAVVTRAERAGCPAIVFTVDLQGGSNRLTNKRFAKLDDRECTTCHVEGERHTPNYEGLEVPRDGTLYPSQGRNDYVRSLTWDFVQQLKGHTSMKVLIKGINTAEDAALAVDNGVDGIIVSNHGGRAENSRRATIESLPEVVDAVQGRIAVLVDSGFRRGVDFFKALAIGADAVCIGRPYLWGLASFGQAGIEAVLEILKAEIEIVMRQMGTTSISQIRPSSIVDRMGGR
jgi:4-hydroxymandelate oxidase